MDTNTYYSLKQLRATTLLNAIVRAQEAFLHLQQLEERFHPSEDDHDEDVRELGHDLLDLLANTGAFRDAVAPLADAALR